MHTNPTSRQRVDGSSPLYNRQNHPVSTRIPHRGSVWIVQVLSTIVRTTPRAHESHIAAACGSFKLSLHSPEPPRKHTNPTSRQRVDRSSSLYIRQNHPASTRIPHRGSVWIVQ